ncbi:hypothetical protein TNCV_3489341 [Trichonephila clavipes]|nr:hypothetical protein TNCV_3489341 [Trichonephila clavipes]
MATGSALTQNYSRSQSEIQGDLHKCNDQLEALHPGVGFDATSTIQDISTNFPAQTRHSTSMLRHGGGGFLAWECKSVSELGNLVFFDGIVNHELYLNILKINFKLSAQNLGIGDDFIF